MRNLHFIAPADLSERMLMRLGILCLLVLLAGCKKESKTATAPEVAPPIASTSAAKQPAKETAGAARSQAEVDALLGELTQATRKFAMDQRRVPKTLEEVAASGYLNQVPSPPPGKRWAIDKELRVYVTGR